MNLMRRAIHKVAIWFISSTFGNVAVARWRGVSVGDGCRLYIRNFGSEPFLIAIGNRVTITQGCVLLTHDGSTWLVRDVNGIRYQRFAAITIGDDVFLGANSIVLPGVTIGNRVVVGAGSVVTKNIPDGSIYAGNPARRIGSYDDFCLRIEQSCIKDSELKDASSHKARVQMALDANRDKTVTGEK